jgi:hypothetical protein
MGLHTPFLEGLRFLKELDILLKTTGTNLLFSGGFHPERENHHELKLMILWDSVLG